MFLKLNIKTIVFFFLTLDITTKIVQAKLLKLRNYNKNNIIIVLETNK